MKLSLQPNLVEKLVWVPVISSVLPFFLFERTSSPVLTFKNFCDSSPSTGLSQVPKYESFGSGFITFFQIQEPLELVF
jgi:hypothetical protein